MMQVSKLKREFLQRRLRLERLVATLSLRLSTGTSTQSALVSVRYEGILSEDFSIRTH